MNTRRTASELLAAIEQDFSSGAPAKALGRLPRHTQDPLLNNARGVCLLRLGRADEALETYRALVIDGESRRLVPGLPVPFYTNYATAHLLRNDVAACQGLLQEIAQPEHPSVRRLTTLVERWHKSLGWWPRLLFALYGEVRTSVPLDFPPGELVHALPEHPLRAA